MAIELYELGNYLSLNPPLAKESLQHIPTAACQHASLDLHSMVQLRVVEHLHHRVDRTSLGIVGTIHQPLDTRVNQGSRAHGARLNCSKQITVSQSMVAQDGARFTQGSDLGVRSWVSARQVAIPPLCDHTAFANHDRSHGHLARLQRALRRTESLFHEQFVSWMVNHKSSVSLQLSAIDGYAWLDPALVIRTEILPAL
jgi:hypothetical protein